ncbi:recombinase family protein [Dehalogenimonas sp. THU2]|uniref:recombinase family protein n=1 Tax=Dehalogenimonas sp. THU2 TaxID=3151121 RepID=UPI0032181448
MENPERRAVIYARVSSDKQDVDLSISAQLRALKEYATRNHFQVVKEFIDEAETGRTTARPAFREMVSLARRTPKPFDVILVWKYSRFARSREDSIVYKALLRKNGIQVVSINEPFDDTPTGRLLEAIIESLDEFYSDNLGEEVTRGLKESASRGFYLSHKAPYGYRKIKVKDGTKERTRLEIDTCDGKTVASLFDKVVHGQGLTEIAKELNAKLISSPAGKTWGKTSVRAVLANEVYLGIMVWGRQNKRGFEPIRVEGAFPPIVSKETFVKVQRLLRERAPNRMHPKRVISKFLLSGLVRCGHCGKALVGADAKSGRFTYYACGTIIKKGTGSCLGGYLNSTKFEGQVIRKIKENILTTSNLYKLVGLVNEEMDVTSNTYRDEFNSISAEMLDANRRLESLYDAVETRKIDLSDLSPRIHDLRLHIESLKDRKLQLEGLLSERRIELADSKIIDAYVNDLRIELDSGALTERKAFIKTFVKEIEVIDKKAVLRYTIPLTPKALKEETIRVLSTEHYGGPSWSRTRDLGLIRN